jgi:hypothetical protein
MRRLEEHEHSKRGDDARSAEGPERRAPGMSALGWWRRTSAQVKNVLDEWEED